ncbi:nodulation efficiency protein NfeD [Halostagnicola sp. A-GB9-2]|uniref:nodulation efficiency protein NfeD n=1 Tax=Halostagnicola sp. A-GB9-2 TaxID=3048066 RepID=UPI0024BF376C|nr:nodulation efficiency protein NfeD [Halostagnicola sp. A-GB9-2]MDJ1432750.1 nodulation efficiency protein NfeD [Halostagnicola sp. A-GB9-2]
MIGLKIVLFGMTLVLAATVFGTSAGLLVLLGVGISFAGIFVGSTNTVGELK